MNEVGRLYSVLYIMYNIYSVLTGGRDKTVYVSAVLDSNINFKGQN